MKWNFLEHVVALSLEFVVSVSFYFSLHLLSQSEKCETDIFFCFRSLTVYLDLVLCLSDEIYFVTIVRLHQSETVLCNLKKDKRYSKI